MWYTVNKVKTKTLHSIITNTIPFISSEWKERYGALLHKQHLTLLTNQILRYKDVGFVIEAESPFFSEEILIATFDYFASLKEVVWIWDHEIYPSNEEASKGFALAIEETPIEELLKLLGQRWTSASIKDENAIPPLKEQILRASAEKHNDQISKSVRAWEKHAQRSEESFWGTVTGNPSEKEAKVQQIIAHVLEHTTWWNVFHHYKHEIVYEARIASGYGIRWKKENLELIGFLEPFLE